MAVTMAGGGTNDGIGTNILGGIGVIGQGILGGGFGEYLSGANPGGPNETEAARKLKYVGDMYGAGILKNEQQRDKIYETPTIANAPKQQISPIERAAVSNAGLTTANALSAQGAQMQGAQLDTAQADQTRQAQNQLISGLQQTAAGRGPSVAQEQLRQSTAANTAQQASAAQAAHGAARLAAMRNASQQQAQIQQQANSQAAQLRAQEIATAQGQLSGLTGSVRNQDLTTAATNAGLLQQTGMTNAQLGQGNAQFNAQLGQQAALQNALQANQLAQFNAGASNLAATNYAGAANQQNLSANQNNFQGALQTNQLNQNATLQTNALNVQNQDLLGKYELGAFAGMNDTYGQMYKGELDYQKELRERGNEKYDSWVSGSPLMGSGGGGLGGGMLGGFGL